MENQLKFTPEQIKDLEALVNGAEDESMQEVSLRRSQRTRTAPPQTMTSPFCMASSASWKIPRK